MTSPGPLAGVRCPKIIRFADSVKRVHFSDSGTIQVVEDLCIKPANCSSTEAS